MAVSGYKIHDTENNKDTVKLQQVYSISFSEGDLVLWSLFYDMVHDKHKKYTENSSIKVFNPKHTKIAV